jgi:hypothetical protein
MKRLSRDSLVSLIATSLLLGSCVSDEKTQGRTQSPEPIHTDNVRIRGKHSAKSRK